MAYFFTLQYHGLVQDRPAAARQNQHHDKHMPSSGFILMTYILNHDVQENVVTSVQCRYRNVVWALLGMTRIAVKSGVILKYRFTAADWGTFCVAFYLLPVRLLHQSVGAVQESSKLSTNAKNAPVSDRD
ncbi:unnamed protein product [Clavelina lepadiformis]|uniref:Uncharacterized protein n=1 Tax=Clavelina lepadiformis TaxID=159417 RepID=A0ABP0GKW1_CLALP